ncbi:MAG: ribosome biogenesis GTP-binding protein YihA/YsxC [Clostridia bacterium]
MKIKEAKYELTAVQPSQYPAGNLPEFAFAGRSNVGKSSVINSLLNRKNLARVGSKPGRTKEMNFYNIDNILRFVDLPGYGYAGVSKSKKSSWGEMAEVYLTTRKQLKAVILLVDIRHKPSADDIQMNEWLMINNVPYIVSATKSDKVKRGEIKNRLNEISSVLKLSEINKPITSSSVEKHGMNMLWEAIENNLKSDEIIL